MRESFVFVAAAVLFLSWGCAHCLALCVPIAELTLVDRFDAGILPGTGTLTIDGNSQSFDCSPGGISTPTGSAHQVDCADNKLTISANLTNVIQLTLSVAQLDGGASFSGTVPLAFVETAREVCGTKCRVAATNITLQ